MKITLSGIDEQTNLDLLSEYKDYSSGVEFAILLSANPEGRHRYPSLDWIKNTVHNTNLVFAVHICGSEARKRALAGEYNEIIMCGNVNRVQVNGKVSKEELQTFSQRLPYTVIITQDCAVNIGLAQEHGLPNHQILIDGSGGNGIERKNWFLPNHLNSFTGAIGFAGGLGPDNLEKILPQISSNKLLHEPWVDMETKLRDENDWFSIDKAKKCINLVQNF